MKITLMLGAATLAMTFSACGDSSKYVSVNATNAANKSNTAVVTNTNTSPVNTVAAPTNTASTVTTAAVEGDVLKIDEAGVMMTVPKGMNFSKDGQDTVVKTADDGVDTRFTILSEDNLDKAFDNAGKEIDEYITGAKFDSEEPKKSMQNGLEIQSWSGTGKASNGDNVKFQMAIVSGSKKPLLALTYAEEESLQKHQADLSSFFASVKKQ